MAFKTLTILEKNIGDPLESVLTTKRTSVPQILTPEYIVDPSGTYVPIYRQMIPGSSSEWFIFSNKIETDLDREQYIGMYDTSIIAQSKNYSYMKFSLDPSIVGSEGSPAEFSVTNRSYFGNSYNAAQFVMFTKDPCTSSLNKPGITLSVTNDQRITDGFTINQIILRPKSVQIGYEGLTGIPRNASTYIYGQIYTDGSAGYTGTVIAGQTMKFINGLLISVT